MSKKIEIFKFGNNGIPKGLTEKLVIPKHIESKGNLLSPYVSKSLIPKNVDLILIEDLNNFYQRLTKNPFAFLSSCRGLYVAKEHIWIPKKHYEKINQALKDEYGIGVKRALLLPQGRIDYWTIIHEALHDVFNHLSLKQRERIIQSAINSYDTSDKLYNMLDLTHLSITNFEWDLDEMKRRLEKIKKTKNSLEDFKDFYTFDKLNSTDQLQLLDEYISNFFANNRVNNRDDKEYLPDSFKTTLKEIGYKIDNPPEIKY